MKKRILIVDDKHDFIEIAGAALERPEWEIVITIDGDSTIKTLQQGDFNLMILDILMPSQDGLEIT